MMKYSMFNEEVLYTKEPITRVSGSDITILKAMAAKNPRKRIRLCAHTGVDDPLHEMIIVHTAGTYVRPHKHPNKSESFHIIEGGLKIIFFDNSGEIKDVVRMGLAENDIMYYRLSESLFHTVIPTSEVVVFHETTNGPFRREDTVVAPWSPAENDKKAQTSYMQGILTLLEKFESSPPHLS
jgi:cupin fold WbuC family metalloprotein